MDGGRSRVGEAKEVSSHCVGSSRLTWYGLTHPRPAHMRESSRLITDHAQQHRVSERQGSPFALGEHDPTSNN